MGSLKIVIAILIWSSLGIFVRKIELPNESIVFYTSIIAGLIQFIAVMSKGFIENVSFRNSTKMSTFLLVLSPLCFVANTMFFYYAFRNTTIANAVLTHYTAPIFVVFLAPLLLKEKIRRAAWIAIILSSIGLILILGGENHAREMLHGSSAQLGIIAGALSGLAYAFLIIIIKKIAHIYSSLFIIFIQNCITALVLFPFVIGLPFPIQTIPYLLLLGVFHSTVAPMLYVQGFRSVKANEAAILGYFEPVGATVLAFIFFHEVPGIKALAGGMLIIYSGYLTIRNSRAT